MKVFYWDWSQGRKQMEIIEADVITFDKHGDRVRVRDLFENIQKDIGHCDVIRILV